MKKRTISVLLALVLCLALALPVAAADVGYPVTGGNVYFDPATGLITGCDDTVTKADIPAKIYDVPVVGVKDNAFEGKKTLASIHLPDSVSSIGKCAFMYCTNLKEANIPDGVTDIKANTFLFCSALTSIDIPNSVTNISDSAFEKCQSLISVKIPDSVVTMEREAFMNCDSLKEVQFGNGLTAIPRDCFHGCSGLEKIGFSASIKEIGWTAFSYCDALKSVSIPDTVTSLTYRAFADCDGLETVVIGSGVDEIGDSAFSNCGKLKAVQIKSGASKINRMAFKRCKELQRIFIPASVQEIGYEAFSGCDNLTDVYYESDLAHWGSINVNNNDNGNDELASAKLHLNSKDMPMPEPSAPTESVQPAITFSDVPSSEYYAPAVDWAVKKEITDGTSDTTFSPDATCTRGQIVTFLWRSLGSPKADGARNPFSDVEQGDYFYDAVLWAVAQKITDGTTATTFSPDDGCTRGQVVTFLHRFEKTPKASSAKNPFADVASDSFYFGAVLWAVEKKITDGTSDTTFSPDATCTRGQIVTFLYRDMGE